MSLMCERTCRREEASRAEELLTDRDSVALGESGGEQLIELW